MLLETQTPLLCGPSISVHFHHDDPRHTFQALGNVIFSLEDGPMCRYGVKVQEIVGGHSDAIEAFLTRLSEHPPVDDRRDGTSARFFPVRRRNNDSFNVRFLENPYERFANGLADLQQHIPLKTVVVSPPLSFLWKKIRRAVPKPRIISSFEIDDDMGGGLALIVNIDCRRRHEPYTLLDFEELATQRRNSRVEPMQSLIEFSRKVPAGSVVGIVSVAPLTDRRLVSKYLSAAKFHEIQFLSDHAVLAQKRSLRAKKLFNESFLLEELQTAEEIDEVHRFSESLYDKTNHYEKDIDALFVYQSDYYRVKHAKNGQVITCGRVSWHLPGLPLPMMLAVKPGTEEHIYLTHPETISYGEVYAPYMLSVTTGKVYGELIKTVYEYCARGDMDYIMTTYQATQEREYRFLSRCVGFRDTRINLQYGSFGGEWSVVYASKDMFDANWQLRFASTNTIPTMYKDFR